MGLHKHYKFDQEIFSAQKYCGSNSLAYVSINAAGEVDTIEDFGQTIIGTLNDFQFAQAFAFYRQSEFRVELSAGLQAVARARVQTPLRSLDGHDLNGRDFNTFGANFNIKGILRVNPYFDVRAQIQAEAITSIQGHINVNLHSDMFHYMFPETLESIPPDPHSPFQITTAYDRVNSPGIIAGAVIGGQVTISIAPVLGINIEIDAFGHSSKTNIETVFRGDVQMRFAASASTDCKGFILGATVGFNGSLAVTGATIFPGWVDNTYNLINKYANPLENVCIPFQGSIAPSKRSIANGTYGAPRTLGAIPGVLRPRADNGAGAIFPDFEGSGVYCPDGPKDDDPVSCKRGFSDLVTADDPDDYNSPPSLVQRGLSKRSLEKRAGNKVFCDDALKIDKPDKMNLKMPPYLSSGRLLQKVPTVATYAPLHVDNCNNFDIGLITTPTDGIPIDKAGRPALQSKLRNNISP